ncbi:MAG: DUF485 domain-containing protein [Halothiobacillus sp.]
MKSDLAERIASNPDFQNLVRQRTGYGWMMAMIMIIIYFAFILSIAYFPSILAIKIAADSPISWGILIGFLMLVFAFVLTGLYVHKANTQFDALTTKIKESA